MYLDIDAAHSHFQSSIGDDHIINQDQEFADHINQDQITHTWTNDEKSHTNYTIHSRDLLRSERANWVFFFLVGVIGSSADDTEEKDVGCPFLCNLSSLRKWPLGLNLIVMAKWSLIKFR